MLPRPCGDVVLDAAASQARPSEASGAPSRLPPCFPPLLGKGCVSRPLPMLPELLSELVSRLAPSSRKRPAELANRCSKPAVSVALSARAGHCQERRFPRPVELACKLDGLPCALRRTVHRQGTPPCLADATIPYRHDLANCRPGARSGAAPKFEKKPIHALAAHLRKGSRPLGRTIFFCWRQVLARWAPHS